MLRGSVTRLAALSIAAVALVVACGPDGATDTTATASSSTSDSGSTGSATASASASTSTGGETGTAATTSATGDGEACDERMCVSGEYCNWAKDSCGEPGTDLPVPDQGQCVDLPDACEKILAPVCGCDGQIHDNQCFAASMGIDVSAAGGCEPPLGQFACGFRFCGSGEAYCLYQFTDITISPDTYTCTPLPDGCGDTPTCDCIVDVPCVDFGCETLPGGDLLVSC
jgi:hypothetical protein